MKSRLASIFTIALLLGFVYWITDAFINAYFKDSTSLDTTLNLFYADLQVEPDIYSRLIAILLLLMLGLISYYHRREISSQNKQLIKLREELEATNEKLNHIVFTDELTGTINRKPFIELLENKMAEARKSNFKVALLFLDLNKFKLINDLYGHTVGDKVLTLAAETIRKSIGSTDFVGRYGGDEFIVCLYGIRSKEAVENTVKKIVESFSKEFYIDSKKIDLRTTIGISIFPDDGNEVDDLLNKSDSAMYLAKSKNAAFEYYKSQP